MIPRNSINIKIVDYENPRKISENITIVHWIAASYEDRKMCSSQSKNVRYTSIQQNFVKKSLSEYRKTDHHRAI